MTAVAPPALTGGATDAGDITGRHLLRRRLLGAGPPLAPGHALTLAVTDAPLAVDATTIAHTAEAILVVHRPAATGPTRTHTAAHLTGTHATDAAGLPRGPGPAPAPGRPSAGAGTEAA